MKKQILLLAMSLLPMVADSQTYVGNWPSNDLYSIPRDMSDKQHTYLCSSNYHDGFVTIEITDENLEKVKEFDINNSLYKYRVLQEELPVTLIVNNATLTPIGEADTWEDAKNYGWSLSLGGGEESSAASLDVSSILKAMLLRQSMRSSEAFV